MKTALSSTANSAPSNIIFFPGYASSKTGHAKKLSASTRQSTPMKTGEIHLRELSQIPSLAKERMPALISETREIITRHFGATAATASSQMHCPSSTDSRGMSLYALPAEGRPEPSVKKSATHAIDRPMKISKTQALMEELFAQKRQEKPPENFFRDFIEEFHRRMEPSLVQQGPSGIAAESFPYLVTAPVSPHPKRRG